MKLARLGVIGAVLTFLAESAAAHTGVGPTGSLGAGFLHPLTGADHLLAMVAVGTYAAMKGGRAVWLVPACFLGAMVTGGILGVAGVPVPAVELGIVGSVILLGLMIAADLRLSTPVAMAVVALFGLFHGHAHGTEMPVDGQGLVYGAGFLMATAGLHLAGIALGLLLGRELRHPMALRVGGGAVAAVGLVLLLAG